MPRLLRFRKEHDVALRGDYVELLPESKELYVYERNLNGKKLLVICSFTDKQIRFQAPPGIVLDEKALALGNYEKNFVIANGFTTRPFELRVYLFETAAKNSEFGIRNAECEEESEPADPPSTETPKAEPAEEQLPVYGDRPRLPRQAS